MFDVRVIVTLYIRILKSVTFISVKQTFETFTWYVKNVYNYVMVHSGIELHVWTLRYSRRNIVDLVETFNYRSLIVGAVPQLMLW